VKKASLINNSNSAGEGKNKQTLIDVVKLELLFKVKYKPSMFLEFYNNEYDRFYLTGELEYAEKWADVINNAVKE
jgi:hypothetical protein